MNQTEELSSITMEKVKEEFARACQRASTKDEEYIFFILKRFALQFNVKKSNSKLYDEHYVFLLQQLKELSFEAAKKSWSEKSIDEKIKFQSQVRGDLLRLFSLQTHSRTKRIGAKIITNSTSIKFIDLKRALSFNAKDIHPEKLSAFLDASKADAIKRAKKLESKRYKQACTALQIAQERAQLEAGHLKKQKESECEISIERAIGCGMRVVKECIASFRGDEIESLHKTIFLRPDFLLNLSRYIQSNYPLITLNSKQLAIAISECQSSGGSHV
jgi:hypothetical protein